MLKLIITEYLLVLIWNALKTAQNTNDFSNWNRILADVIYSEGINVALTIYQGTGL